MSEARAAGVPTSRLRASDLVIPTRGVRAPRVESPSPPVTETASARLARLRADLTERVRRIAPALTPHQFFSHDTALALIGAPLPYTTAAAHAIHVSARRPSGQPRRAGVIGHRLQAREPARWHVGGVPIEHPARVWRQAGDGWDLDDVIAAGDFLVHPRRSLLSIDDLRAEVVHAGDVGGKLRRALAQIRVGAETAEETRLRLTLARAGLPEPALNHNLTDGAGRFVARLDLAYPRHRVAVEHDGRIHAFDEAQFARDADRWDDIRALGWTLVRILSHHLRPDPQAAIDKVAAALWDAGWRPGR